MTDPIHTWFGLTYSNYLVLPRSLLQSMPEEWQARLVVLLEEMETHFSAETRALNPTEYQVRAKSKGKYVEDPFSSYERGRRVVK